MSVMLIRPITPETSRSGIVSVQYPLNIGYLVSYLKKHDIKCFVKDFEVEPFSENEFLETLRKSRPLLIGFSCMTPHIMNAAALARLVKANFPGIATVVGGVHASAIPKQTLEEFPEFDVVVIGEGEETLLALYLACTESKSFEGITGIAFRENAKVRINPPRPLIENIDIIPFPDRELIDIECYKKSHVSRGFSRKTTNIAEIICSRGCPYSCIFCASKVAHSNRVRFRSAQNIIEEIKDLTEKHRTQHLSFLDDTFTIRMDLLKPVCEYLRAQNVTFDCFTRVNDIDEEKISIMVAAGCKKISFGIESGSPKVLSLLKKGITIERVEEAFEIVKKAGLPTIEATFLIGGHPDEDIEDIELTRKFIYRLKPDILGIFIAIPYPGTELNRILKERGLLLKENWNDFTLFFGNPSWELGKVPMKQLQKLLKEIMYGYYLNPSYILALIKKIKNFKEFRYYFDLGLAFIRTRFHF